MSPPIRRSALIRTPQQCADHMTWRRRSHNSALQFAHSRELDADTTEMRLYWREVIRLIWEKSKS
jgi:hypothetical protein